LNLDSFLQGLIAGYGIAIPIGPIAILIIELGLRRGFWVAFFAGAGAASADLIYSSIASIAGTFLVSILKPVSSWVHFVSGLVLIAIGLWLFLHRKSTRDHAKILGDGSSSRLKAYAMILGLTILNPLTVTYFTTLILGLRINFATTPAETFLFVSGAFLASLSWQTLIAGIGGFAHQRLSPNVQSTMFTIGNTIVILLGVLILAGIKY
jgi:arginine exporter protein ArgO